MNIHASGHAVPRREGAACDDAWCVRQRGETLVAALADGVSASREGGAAARRAVDMLVDYYLARPQAWSPRRALAEFASQINRHLHAEALERHGRPELTCTLCAVVIDGGRLYGCNVGDSPVFHWRRARLQALSIAHTVAEPGLQHGLTRAIGLEPEVDPHFFELELADGDLVVLCSDGVTNPLNAERLNELLSRRCTARTVVSTARIATEREPDLADDASAIVLEIIERGHAVESSRQRLEVPRHLHPGDVFGGYRIERPLDPDERVWLAVDERPGAMRVVLKFPSAEAANVEALRDAFVREAWNATRLSSPDLVRAWLPEGDPPCYAMEFIDAPTLRSVLRSGRLSVEEARELGAFLLRVGQYLLQHDLAHADIKPENIIVLRLPAGIQFRLLDLGSAAELFSVTSRAGTPTYLAPERFRGAALSERTEIFAIGVTLYEALTGTCPFGEIERFQSPRFEARPRDPARFNPLVPAWLDTIVMRAVEPDVDRRYQHFSEMAYALEHPAQVAPHHRKNASLLERDPLRLYKLLTVALLLSNLILLGLLARR